MTKEELMHLASAMNGLCILGCLPGSPADLAGLRYGDVVLEVNGVLTPDWAAYLRAVNTPSRVMSVRYFRSGEERCVQLELPTERHTVPQSELLANVATRVLSKLNAQALNVDVEEKAPLLN